MIRDIGVVLMVLALAATNGGLDWKHYAALCVGAVLYLTGYRIHHAYADWQARRWGRSPEGQAWRAELEDAAAEWNAEREAAERKAAQ